MRLPSKSPVVVGVNGTAAGLAAVRLAAREAVSRGRHLRIVHAFSWSDGQPPDPHGAGARGLDVRYDEARRAASAILGEAVATAKRSTPGVRLTGQLVDGPPDRVLLQLSRTAELVVLGDDDLATTSWLPSTSTLVQTAARAFCPVVIARGPRPPSGAILAAVDGSSWSVRGLRHAAAEALRQHATLEIVYVVACAGERAEREGHRILAAAAAAVPQLGRARAKLLTGAPGPALVRASGQARMIVLGPRGTHGAGLLGSVAREVLHRAACPTVFVHGAALPAPRAAGRAGHVSNVVV